MEIALKNLVAGEELVRPTKGGKKRGPAWVKMESKGNPKKVQEIK